ncbi:MAG: OadG family transporter subunit [Lachnospiraceae bacterium]|nr:OadG family transporter subunit [Lachnospiraceae bacterium]
MKKTWKKLTSLILTLTCMLMLLCLPVSAAASAITEEDKASVASTLKSTLEQMGTMSESDLQSFKDSSNFTASFVDAWKSSVDEAGTVVSTGEADITEKEGVLTVKIPVEFEKYSGTMSATFDSNGTTTDTAWSGLTINVNYPMSVLLEQAGMNTLMGICIVFVMLIFLSLIISLFKFVGQTQQTKKAAPAPKVEAPKAPAAAPVVEMAGISDDTEIALVISAAIAAYEEENPGGDGYVVRSIKKVNNRRWKRA